MDFKTTTALLDKINHLHDSLRSSNGQLSSIDKDLLLKKIGELYEIIKFQEGTFKKHIKTTPSYQPEANHATSEDWKNVITPGSEPIPDTAEMEAFVNSINKEIDATTKVDASVPPTPSSTTFTNNSVKKYPDAYNKLFVSDGFNDLSNKLSNKPVIDIYSAMGLNDRFLILSELFNGDKNAFSRTIDELNTFNSFDEAKSYLASDVIPTFNWMEEQKIDRAKSFLQTVSRRYL